MDLAELKTRLKIPLSDTSQDEFLQESLEDAIDYVKEYCNNPFHNEKGEEVIPGAVKKGVALLVKSMSENPNVASQSLGDMSKSFFKGATMEEAHRYFKPYRRLKFV